ncbi:ADP-ribose glycohydrolase MACROD2 [Penicillium macrosclerotiorum]|uniref:ADP-ribose glycohydrolase MACROD2 n=1 Tax=Penicillium macrosclerotiorum TaxID=303699 RepID=UPI0025484CF8|nr:ADP-ribose glycohydrolase MACROD2 [Penicillium macrosclerotiorum]KAJ5692686.1 ADP-ribose glycohydrolase MACROD2 [Penicillium macrosclerotiorum]
MSSQLITLEEIPTLSSLYRRGQLDAGESHRIPSQTLNDVIACIRQDITTLQVDCIVNAANQFLLGGGGVDGAIHRAAGPELAQECLFLDGCAVGEAKITSAYNLPCEKVIHTVGPMYGLERQHESDSPEQLLRSCYRRSLELAVANEMRSIAFAAISTGVYAWPSQDAANSATDEVRKFLERPENVDKLDRIIFCNFERRDMVAYKVALP